MYRSRSKGTLELPSNASAYRSYSMLKAVETVKVLPVTSRLKTTPTHENQEKSFFLNDSVLCETGEDFISRAQEEELLFTPRKTHGCPAAVMESLKTHYIAAMKDIRKGFPSICDLVNCAVSVVAKTAHDDDGNNMLLDMMEFLTTQRFWVSCPDMRSRYGVSDLDVPSVDILPVEPAKPDASVTLASDGETTGESAASNGTSSTPVAESDSQMDSVSVEPVEQGAEQCEQQKIAMDKEKEKNKLRDKRFRRFHFQVLIRIALYKVLQTRNLLDHDGQVAAIQILRTEIADLIVARERYDAWRFMEADIQYKCGTDPSVRELINEVCGELLVPLPDYSPDRRPAKKPSVILRSNSRTGQPGNNGDSSSQSSGPFKGRAAGKLRPFPSRQLSTGSLQSSNCGVRPRFRQRSCLDYDVPLPVQRSNSSSSLTKIPELKKSQSLDAYASQRITSQVDGCFESIFKPTQYPSSMESDKVFKPVDRTTVPGSRTPVRHSVPCPPSPRGTPYRERRAALAGSLHPESPKIRASAFLTTWSPFKRVGQAAPTPNETSSTDILKPRRQLMF